MEAGKNCLHPRFFSHVLRTHDQFPTGVFFYWQRRGLGTCLIYFSSISLGSNPVKQEPAGLENQTTAYRQAVNSVGLLLSTPNAIWKNTTSPFSCSRSVVGRHSKSCMRRRRPDVLCSIFTSGRKTTLSLHCWTPLSCHTQRFFLVSSHT